MTRYVIIGNSAAAVGCVEGIRQVDREGPITIISDEPHHTYSRPLISYLLEGKTDPGAHAVPGSRTFMRRTGLPLCLESGPLPLTRRKSR